MRWKNSQSTTISVVAVISVQMPIHGSDTSPMRHTPRPIGRADSPRSLTPHSMAITDLVMIASPSVTMITANNGRPSIGRRKKRSAINAVSTRTIAATAIENPHGIEPDPTTTMYAAPMTNSPWAKLNTPEPLNTMTNPSAMRRVDRPQREPLERQLDELDHQYMASTRSW